MRKKSDLSRREFLTRSAAVTGGIVSLGVLGGPGRITAQETAEFEVLTDQQAATVVALAERIMPRDSSGPGATDAQVVVYIDRALATHHVHEKEIYDHGLVWLDTFSSATQGKPFVELTSDLQDAVLSALDSRQNPPEWPTEADMTSRAWLRHMIEHTMEGMFADPKYGGNRNEVGWKLINFPGLKPFGYDPPFGYYDAIIPEIEYPAFVPYTGPGKEG